MSIGLYDADIRTYPNLPFNLEIMKLASYYLKRGEITVLSPQFEPERYSYFFYRQDYPTIKKIPNFTKINNLKYGGLYFTNGKYVPLEEEIEKMQPNTEIYRKFGEGNFALIKDKNNFNKLLKANHFRFSLDDKKIWINYEKQFNNITRHIGTLFNHDVDLSAIDGSYEELKNILYNKNLFLAVKFPINVNNLVELEKWLMLPLSRNYSEIQYKTFMSFEELKDFICILENKNYINSISYSPVLCVTSEVDFLNNYLIKIVQQVSFLKSKQIKILLKNESPFLIDYNYELLFTFLNQYLNWKGDFKGGQTIQDFCLSIYRYVSKGKIVKNNWITLEKLKKIFSFLKEKSYETFEFFRNGG